jgi:hypothetical protein
VSTESGFSCFFSLFATIGVEILAALKLSPTFRKELPSLEFRRLGGAEKIRFPPIATFCWGFGRLLR